MSHSFQIRVYYEDTDLAGIVYYANYLKYLERARSEWVRARGIDQKQMKAEEGIVFAVRRVEADYLFPAKFDDLIEVRTEMAELKHARVVMAQDIWRGETCLFRARVTLVAIGADGLPRRLPAVLRS